MEVGPLARMLVAYASWASARSRRWSTRCWRHWALDRKCCSLPWAAPPRAASNRFSWRTSWLNGLTNWPPAWGAVIFRFMNGAPGSLRTGRPRPGMGLYRGAAGCAGPLDSHQGSKDLQLPGRSPQYVELLAARCAGRDRSVRGCPDRHAHCRPRATAGGAAHHPLFRSLHGVRCTRAGRAGTRDRQRGRAGHLHVLILDSRELEALGTIQVLC